MNYLNSLLYRYCSGYYGKCGNHFYYSFELLYVCALSYTLLHTYIHTRMHTYIPAVIVLVMREEENPRVRDVT